MEEGTLCLLASGVRVAMAAAAMQCREERRRLGRKGEGGRERLPEWTVKWPVGVPFPSLTSLASSPRTGRRRSTVQSVLVYWWRADIPSPAWTAAAGCSSGGNAR